MRALPEGFREMNATASGGAVAADGARESAVYTSTVFAVPTYAAAASEDLLAGGRGLRQAFNAMPPRTAPRHSRIVTADDPAPPALRITRGVAYRACAMPDGRRVILDLLLPNDIYGIDHLVMARANHELVAASEVSYRALPIARLQARFTEPAIAARALALVAETQRRMDRHAAAVCRLEARERIAALLLDVHDRLRRHGLINTLSFNLPLTQEEIADHLGLTMVHVSRTLRRLREDRVVLVDRQVVIIRDLDGLRGLADGLPPLSDDGETVGETPA